MDKVLSGQIVHTVCHLATEGEQLSGEGGRDDGRSSGRGRWGGAGTVCVESERT